MARIPLSTFTKIPEGVYDFIIFDVEYKEAYGKLNVRLLTKDGLRYTQSFRLKNSRGEYNDKVLNFFSFFAQTAMGEDFKEDDIDPMELVGHYIHGCIENKEVESTKEPGTMVSFQSLNELSYGTPWTDMSEISPSAMKLLGWDTPAEPVDESWLDD